MDQYSPNDHHLDISDLIRHAKGSIAAVRLAIKTHEEKYRSREALERRGEIAERLFRLHEGLCPARQAEDRLREILAEHERTHHGGLPAPQAEPLPYTSSTKDRFVAVLTKAVARAVELGIRLHREAS